MHAQQQSWTLGAFLAAGIFGYCYLLMPSGKVLRDKMEAGYSRPRFWARRILPFLGFGVPFVMMRLALTPESMYTETPRPYIAATAQH